MKRLQPSHHVAVLCDEAEPMTALRSALESLGRYSFSVCGQADAPNELDAFDAVIMYIHGQLEARVESLLIEYAEAGGRLVVLHHGVASAKRANPKWLRFLGVHIAEREDPKFPWNVVSHVTHTVVNLNPNHFITSNGVEYPSTVRYLSSDVPSADTTFQSFDLPDTEVFENQCFTDGRAKTVLFGTTFVRPDADRSGSGTTAGRATGDPVMADRAGWVKPTGKGTVVYFQPGHSSADFANKTFCQIIHNAIVWDSIELQLPPVQIPSNVRRKFYVDDPFGWRDITPDSRLNRWNEYDWPPGSALTEPRKSARWSLAEAAGVLSTPGTPHTHLLSEEQFADFVLHVEWRYLVALGSLNSGVFVRMVPGQRVMHQIECLMGRSGIIMGGRLDDGVLHPISAIIPDGNGGWDRIPNHTSNGWTPEIRTIAATSGPEIPAEFLPSERVVVHEPGEWNTFEILCVGPRITVWTNGAISSHTTSCTVPVGSIGFESEGHPVEFRNITIKIIRNPDDLAGASKAGVGG